MLKPEPKVFAAACRSNGEAAPASGAPSDKVAVPTWPQANLPASPSTRCRSAASSPSAPTAPQELKDKLDDASARSRAAGRRDIKLPDPSRSQAPERLVIDFGNHDELLDKAEQGAQGGWLRQPGRLEGAAGPGHLPRQRPQARQDRLPVPRPGQPVPQHGPRTGQLRAGGRRIFKEADQVMTPILGRPLTSYIFVDSNDPAAMQKAEIDLMQTAITQPAMLTMDTAMYRLLGEYGFRPDMVMGHSLGEYGALIAAGIMPFADALEASAARGAEMTKVSMDDNGWMAAVMAPLDVILEDAARIDGYVVAANINSYNQCVVGGETRPSSRPSSSSTSRASGPAHPRQPRLPHPDRGAGQRAAARGAGPPAHLRPAAAAGRQRHRRALPDHRRGASRTSSSSRSPRPCSG